MGIVDAIILVLLFIGILDGIRKGALKTVVELVGSILVVVLSWIFKGTVANVLINRLPVIGKNPAISALIYHIIAFVILLILFALIYRIILGISNFIEKVFDATIVLGIVSKIIGGILGFIKAYVFIFIALFILSIFNIGFLRESKMNNFILEKTPFSTSTWKSIKEVYTSSDIEGSIKKLFENNIITEENMNKLLDVYEENK